MEEKNYDYKNIVISIIIYVFMFLLVGSSLIIIFVAMAYISKHPDVSYIDLMKSLSGLVDPMTLEEHMQRAYSIVGSYGNMITYAITTVAVVILMRKMLIDDAIKVKNNIFKYIGIFFISLVVFYSITIVVDGFIGKLVGESNNQNSIIAMISGGGATPMFISVVLCAPLVEELIYRKAIFKIFEKKHIIISYIVSSVFFVIPHMLSTDMSDITRWALLCIPYTISALLLAGIYHVSGKNIWASWFVHMMNNLLAYVGIIMLMQM